MLDSKEPSTRVEEYMRFEARFRMVERVDPQRFSHFAQEAQRQAERRRRIYEELSAIRALGALDAPRRGSMTIDLSTTYLGLELAHPMCPAPARWRTTSTRCGGSRTRARPRS